MNNESGLTDEATEAIKFLLSSSILKLEELSKLIKIDPPTLYALLKEVRKEQ